MYKTHLHIISARKTLSRVIDEHCTGATITGPRIAAACMQSGGVTDCRLIAVIVLLPLRGAVLICRVHCMSLTPAQAALAHTTAAAKCHRTCELHHRLPG